MVDLTLFFDVKDLHGRENPPHFGQARERIEEVFLEALVIARPQPGHRADFYRELLRVRSGGVVFLNHIVIGEFRVVIALEVPRSGIGLDLLRQDNSWSQSRFGIQWRFEIVRHRLFVRFIFAVDGGSLSSDDRW